MNDTEAYYEDLKTSGRLKVTPTSWSIEYYFPGPDRRYNGSFYEIPSEKVEVYIDALNENWEECLKLEKHCPYKSRMTKTGLEGMHITVGKYDKSVSLFPGHYQLHNRKEINKLIQTFQYAQKRAPEILETLYNVQGNKFEEGSERVNKRSCGTSLVFWLFIFVALMAAVNLL